ncbi:MAG: hypothetical protein K9L70_10930 [Thiohalocapsa sp.]|nr:hypothetical protein [Thiohalocapsa sp.]MCF7991477.1 hypothetical protein [Thiohalocapsa sp.]
MQLQPLAAVLDRGRRALGQSRVTTGRVARFAGRGYRALHYLWHLLLWSRISVGRSGVLPIELPRELLLQKGIVVDPPSLAVSGHADAQSFSRGFAEIYTLLFANLQSADLLSPTRHAIPGPAFRGVYLWDSAFIAPIWRWWDIEVAADVVLAVVDLRAGDRLQHVVTEFHQSRYTQPPLIAPAIRCLAEALSKERAQALIAKVYGPLCAYQRWLDANRRLSDGLYAWAHPYESGVENAPRFSNTDESVKRNTAVIGAVDFSSYVVLQLESLAEMAQRLGRDADRAAFTAEADALRGRIEHLLWDERAGSYFDRDGAGAPIRVETIASLLPLWAGVPSTDRARRLVARIMDPNGFGTLMPLPSVARDAPVFEKDMWRGPVWLNTAYAVVLGLLRYGYQREAGEIAYRLCRGVYRVYHGERRIYEFYDPDAHETRALRRKRGNWWKALTLGRGPQREFVGWTGLANNLLLEVLLGLQAGPDRLTACPRLPAVCVGMTLKLDLPEPAVGLVVDMVGRDCFRITVSRGGRSAVVTTGFAHRADLIAALDGEHPCATAI